VKIDCQVEPFGSKAPAKCDVGYKVSPGCDDDLIDEWIRRDDSGGDRLDKVGEMRPGKTKAHCSHRRCREHDIANFAKTNQKDLGDLRI
jgi:hypothetical protein